VSSYSYDVAGNRVYESYTAGSGWLQYAIVTWDAANRMTSFGDLSQVSGTPSITWEYDLGGNIRHMNSVYQQLDAQGNLTGTDVTQDYWYKYDSMNRFTTTKGSLVSGAITGGISLTYDAAGRRATKTTGIFNGYYWEGEYASDGHTKIGRIAVTYNKIETYTYSTDGYLASVNFTYDFQGSPPLSDITYTMATYTRDAMGRVTAYSESAFDTVNDFGSTNTGVAAGVYTRTAVYNSKSQVTSDVATTIRSTGTWTASTTYDYKAESSAGSNVYTGAYQGGVVTHQATHTTFPGDYTNAETRNSYVWWDSALNNVTDYDAQSHTGALYPYHATYSYDTNGRLSSVGIVDGRSRTVSFVTDANGLILQRDENDANTTTGDPRELHFYFNGMAVGDVGNNGTSDIDYAASIAEHTATPGTGPFRNGGSTYIIQADFDQSYDPINGLTYENTASRYTVQDGDTLESIAYQIWGDSSFWYMIADANGLSGSETLVAGQDLIIPNKVHNAHNSADTYRVYDPNEAIGNNSPTAPKPQKHGGGACGVMGQVLLVIIAVAVTALTLNPLIGLAAEAGLGTAGAAFVGGALAGAAGSIVSQGVGLATGIQSKFNWGDVALSALSSGISAGIGPQGLNLFGEVGNSFAQGALSGITGSVLTQGIAVATGLQSRFDWAAVAAAGVASGVSNAVAMNIPGDALGQVGRTFVSGMAGAIAGAATRSLITGTDFGDNLLLTLPGALGATVGAALAYEVSGPSSGTQEQPEPGEKGGKVGTDVNSLGNSPVSVSYNQSEGYFASKFGLASHFQGPDGGGWYNPGLVGGIGMESGKVVFTDTPAENLLSVETVVVTAHRLGDLSMYWETLPHLRPDQEARAAAIVSSGRGDPRGGVSYGAWQLSSKTGDVAVFLQNEGLPWADRFDGMNPMEQGGEFGKTWKLVAAEDPIEFFDAQHMYIQRTHYDPLVQHVLNATGVDINSLSGAVQDVVWSISVNHGGPGATTIVNGAIEYLQGDAKTNWSVTGYDEALIDQLYVARAQYVTNYADPSNVPALINRYTLERQDALRLLGH